MQTGHLADRPWSSGLPRLRIARRRISWVDTGENLSTRQETEPCEGATHPASYPITKDSAAYSGKISVHYPGIQEELDGLVGRMVVDIHECYEKRHRC